MDLTQIEHLVKKEGDEVDTKKSIQQSSAFSTECHVKETLMDPDNIKDGFNFNN